MSDDLSPSDSATEHGQGVWQGLIAANVKAVKSTLEKHVEDDKANFESIQKSTSDMFDKMEKKLDAGNARFTKIETKIAKQGGIGIGLLVMIELTIAIFGAVGAYAVFWSGN